MEQTWKTVTAAVLSIVAGGFALMGSIGLALFRRLGSGMVRPGADGNFGTFGFGMHRGMMPGFLGGGFGIAAEIVLALLALLAILGGVFLLRRKLWGLALAGSIAAILLPMPLGIIGIFATIITILSKKEFA
jgi:hypothetical protein